MTTLAFGKYKGRTLSDVLEIDPSYCVWAASKGLINVTKEQLNYAKEQEYEQRCYAEAVFESEHGDWGDRG